MHLAKGLEFRAVVVMACDEDIIPNAETFECTICYLETEPGDGVVLRECLHTFCK